MKPYKFNAIRFDIWIVVLWIISGDTGGREYEPPPPLFSGGKNYFRRKIGVDKRERVDKKSDKTWYNKESEQPKKWFSSRKFFYEFFSVTQYFLLRFSWSSNIITARNKKTHPRADQNIWDNYIIFAQKYFSSTSLQIWVVYTYMCV